jgi:hypothetical protein
MSKHMKWGVRPKELRISEYPDHSSSLCKWPTSLAMTTTEGKLPTTPKNSLTFNIWSQYFEAGIEVASRRAVTIVRRDKPKCANPIINQLGAVASKGTL